MELGSSRSKWEKQNEKTTGGVGEELLYEKKWFFKYKAGGNVRI